MLLWQWLEPPADVHYSFLASPSLKALGTSFKDEPGVFLSLSLHLPCRESDSIKYSQWVGHFLKGWSILSFRLHLEPPSITLVLMGAKDNPRVFIGSSLVLSVIVLIH